MEEEEDTGNISEKERTAVYCKRGWLENYILHKQKIHKDKKLCREYGFVENLHFSSITNVIIHSNKMTMHEYMNRLENSKLHNLCFEVTCLPLGIGNMLGKGLDCVQPRKISREQK